jgi:hypothetical protein
MAGWLAGWLGGTHLDRAALLHHRVLVQLHSQQQPSPPRSRAHSRPWRTVPGPCRPTARLNLATSTTGADRVQS